MTEIRDFVGGSYTLLVAADHGGFETKRDLIAGLRANGVVVEDVGPHCFDALDDYPDFAFPLARRISTGEAKCGLLICRTGIGMSINANRFPGVRAALADTEFKAVRSREHNCSNVLVTGGDALTVQDMVDITMSWLKTPFSGDERHARRLVKIDTNSQDPFLPLRRVDPELTGLIDGELANRRARLSMIASEGGSSDAVRAAGAAILTEKYVEGQPGKRSYRGCGGIDAIERLAEARFCELFGAESANLQPYSGSLANLAALHALAPSGTTILSLDPLQGGHRTHGGEGTASGDLWKWVHYGVSANTGDVDWDQVEALTAQHAPVVIIAGGSFLPAEVDFARFRRIADTCGAALLADVAHTAGLIAAGLQQSPVPVADVVTMTTHKSLGGPRGGAILCKAALADAVDLAVSPWLQCGVQVEVLTAKAAAAREALMPAFAAKQKRVQEAAQALANALTAESFNLWPASVDGHMVLLDCGELAATETADRLETIGIWADPLPVLHGMSVLRLGVMPAVARGLTASEMPTIAGFIADAILERREVARIRTDVATFLRDKA